MVAQLLDDDMRIAVEGRDGRGRGLVSCECAPRPGSYDHKRHAALRAEGKLQDRRLPVWDFVLRRADGTGIRLHPQWSHKVVETIEVDGHTDPVEPPRKGFGRSEGRGTFRKYVNIGATGSLKFDHEKAPAAPKAKAKAKAKANTK